MFQLLQVLVVQQVLMEQQVPQAIQELLTRLELQVQEVQMVQQVPQEPLEQVKQVVQVDLAVLKVVQV